jgi:hypothetical protein
LQSQYPIFAEYHLYIKRWLKEVMTLPRFEQEGTQIPVVYSTPRRAFAMGSSSEQLGDAGGEPIYAPPQQGNNWLPIVAFHYNGAQQIMGRTIPYEHVLTQKIKDNNDNVTGVKKNKPFQVYSVSYIATVYAGLMQDMDILTFKLLSEFRPQCYLWIGPEDKVNDGTAGLWAHLQLESVTDGTEYEPGDIGERVVRKDFTWTVTEAYVPTVETEIDENIIREVYTDILGPEEELMR